MGYGERVFIVDERSTSRTCAHCLSTMAEAIVSTCGASKRHRFGRRFGVFQRREARASRHVRKCFACARLYESDLNGATNILRIGIRKLWGDPIPTAFIYRNHTTTVNSTPSTHSRGGRTDDVDSR